MDISNFEEYNKVFEEETKDYIKICNGNTCPYVDECNKKGLIVFCEKDDGNRMLRYIRGLQHERQYYSFKDVCRRDSFIPEGGYTRKHLETFYCFGRITFPNFMPPSIDVWIKELKEMGLFNEE